MNTPSVPRPTNPATVAVAMTWLAAERMPARISGSAFGTSTCHSACQPVRPMPRAASRTSPGTLSMPATVFSTIGGMARMTRATSTGQTDSGCQRNTSVTTPIVGIARHSPVTLAATKRPRPVCPMTRPIGRAMTIAAHGGDERVPEVLEDGAADAVAAGPVVGGRAATARPSMIVAHSAAAPHPPGPRRGRAARRRR